MVQVRVLGYSRRSQTDSFNGPNQATSPTDCCLWTLCPDRFKHLYQNFKKAYLSTVIGFHRVCGIDCPSSGLVSTKSFDLALPIRCTLHMGCGSCSEPTSMCANLYPFALSRCRTLSLSLSLSFCSRLPHEIPEVQDPSTPPRPATHRVQAKGKDPSKTPNL